MMHVPRVNKQIKRMLWSDDELRELMRLTKQGLTVPEISKRLNRSEVSVRNKATSQGIGYKNG